MRALILPIGASTPLLTRDLAGTWLANRLPEFRWPGGDPEEMDMLDGRSGEVKVEFVPVGRSRREWMWKARDDSNTITISGHRFDSLGDAVRDARTQIVTADSDDDPDFSA